MVKAVFLTPFSRRAGVDLSQPKDRDYTTVAGFIPKQLGHLPETAENVEYSGWIMEVIDLVGARIDKVLVQRSVTRQ
jgi:putative hemolysin